MAPEASLDHVYRRVSTGLDPVFYRTAYEDMATSRVDPVAHYLAGGWREGRDPAPWFSTSAYLAAHTDIQGANPFDHYLARGWREGREIQPSALGAALLWKGAYADAQVGEEIDPRVAAEFDADFYAQSSPDVMAAGLDPFDHFMMFGWREGRDPNANFSISRYLELNPDLARGETNPFVHFVTEGRAQGRHWRQDVGFRVQALAKLSSVEARMNAAQNRALSVEINPPDELTAALKNRRSKDGAFHLSISHDDYTSRIGGVQLCLQREAAAVAAGGRDHLHLYPIASWPSLREAEWPTAIGVIWNNHDLGAFPVQGVCDVLNLEAGLGRRTLAIHGLMGHAIDDVLAILKAADLYQGFFWLHDFTSLCAGVHLMRNDVADCGAPPPTSSACNICIYGPHRAVHTDAHDRLFKALDLTVVAPAQVTLETWRSGTTAPPNLPMLVHPLARLVPRSLAESVDDGILRVAFLGAPALHKGWSTFVNLATRFAEDPRYRFTHFASFPTGEPAIEFQEVTVSPANPMAARDAFIDRNIDVALIWSLCRETFSFGAHESVAAGAAVLTYADSGNVAAFVVAGDHGRVLNLESELFALFESGGALQFRKTIRRPMIYDLAFSAMTMDLVAAP